MIFNKQYSQEDYEEKINLLKDQAEINKFFKKFNIFYEQLWYSIISIIWSENCTWSRIINSKNCKECFEIENGEDCKFNFINASISNSYDTSQAWHKTAWTYDSLWIASSNNILFSNYIRWSDNNIYYSMNCFHNNANLFGCIGLRNKSYCIFNKQYTKQEYEVQVAKIITHMIETKERGEFFHPSLSPFGYNETVAQEYFPESPTSFLPLPSSGGGWPQDSHQWKIVPPRNGGLGGMGYHRSDYQAPTPAADKILEGKDLPATIDEVSDDILKTAIKCEVTGKLFRIIPQELAFYRKHYLPLPRRHPDQRHLDRLALRK